MSKKAVRATLTALVLGFAIGLLSWWFGQELMSYKPLENQSTAKKDPILAAFQGSGARFKELNLVGWAQINKQYIPETTMISLAKAMAVKFAPLDSFAVEVETDKGWRQIKLELKNQAQESVQENVHILVQSRAGLGLRKAQTYCTINISSNSLQNYKVLKSRFENALINIAEKDKGLSTIITGWYSGSITAKGMKNIANKTLALSGAEVIEGVGEKNFLSISAYTPQIKNEIRIKNKKINFNVALRVNKVDQKTYLYIGSPIIAREY